MKKTQWTDALRNIRRNWVSFLSVLMISLLASVAYLGLVFSAEGLKESANTTYQAGQTADLEITMRINGYTSAETIRYASMECYGITLLGILLGLVAGQVFSSWLFTQIEQLSASFVREPVWISFVASAVITAVISAVIHFAAFRKIRGLKLSDMS